MYGRPDIYNPTLTYRKHKQSRWPMQPTDDILEEAAEEAVELLPASLDVFGALGHSSTDTATDKLFSDIGDRVASEIFGGL